MELMILSLALVVIALLAATEIPERRQLVRVIDHDHERLLQRLRADDRWFE